jgi:hypothetical protein
VTRPSSPGRRCRRRRASFLAFVEIRDKQSAKSAEFSGIFARVQYRLHGKCGIEAEKIQATKKPRLFESGGFTKIGVTRHQSNFFCVPV